MRAVPNRFTPQKAIGFAAAVLLQAGFVYALVSGLAATLIQKLPEELKVAVEQEKIQPKPPPPPPPQVDIPPPPVAPPPDINIQVETPTSPITVTNKPPPPPVVEKPQISSPASIGAKHYCDQNRYYPQLSVKLGEQGTTTLSFKIDTSGNVKDAVVASSSGSDRLDQATINCVSSWRYKPAIQNGQPVEVTWQTAVKWQLH